MEAAPQRVAFFFWQMIYTFTCYMNREISSGQITAELRKKKIRNINLRVVPPGGKVIITVPYGVSTALAKKFLAEKEEWIIKQKERIDKNIFDKEKNYLEGEKHYLFGKPYSLSLVESKVKEGIRCYNNSIYIYTHKPGDTEHNQMLMDDWYRSNLAAMLDPMVRRWSQVAGVKVNELRIRKMKTRWGSCNPSAKRIWINLLLARRRPALIEYIVVHEVCHLLEASHNKRFYALMDKLLPGWKELRKELR